VDGADPDCTQSQASDYDIVRFRAERRGKIGEEIEVKVKIQNNGSTDPGAVLKVVGVQGNTVIPLTPGAGLMVFDRPDRGKTKVTFTYTPVSAGKIIWHATIEDGDLDADQASSATIVSRRGGHDDDEDDDSGGHNNEDRDRRNNQNQADD
jgi:hypothetical protein